MKLRLFPTEPHATKRAVRLAWAFVVLLAVLLAMWLVVTVVRQSDRLDAQQSTNQAQDAALAEANRRLTEAGQQPVPTPEPGPAGQPGPGPTDAQVAAAVAAYCHTTGVCDGRAPTAQQVSSAVSSYCAGGRCVGRPGVSGQPGEEGGTGAAGATGPGPTSDQIAEAVATYCADGRCTGPAGADGVNGTNGQNGANGQDGQSAFPFTFTFTVQTNPAQSTTYTVTCQVDGCAVATS